MLPDIANYAVDHYNVPPMLIRTRTTEATDDLTGSLISIPCWDIRIIIQNLALMSQKDKKFIEVNLKGKELNYHWQFTK